MDVAVLGGVGRPTNTSDPIPAQARPTFEALRVRKPPLSSRPPLEMRRNHEENRHGRVASQPRKPPRPGGGHRKP